MKKISQVGSAYVYVIIFKTRFIIAIARIQYNPWQPFGARYKYGIIIRQTENIRIAV